MDVNNELLKRYMENKQVSNKELADSLGIDVSTLYRKCNGISDFYRNEINIICNLLDIDDPKPVFFANLIA